jgi:asparagine synthase (glutamine-hydrolysing)
MCGIAGILGVDPELARPAAERMLLALQHRGPDDRGIEVVPSPSSGLPPAVLVHTRLAILDLGPAGHQPMVEPPAVGSGACWITYNGEVYNFAQIREELARAGSVASSTCDTEIVLRAYREWGEEAVCRMRGMFAWCLLDPDRNRAWLCRDRLGIKPLYLARPVVGGLVFASELRALLACGPELIPRHVNARAVECFLAQGMVFGPETIIEGVELLDAGESRITDWTGALVSRKLYWQVPFVPAEQTRALRRDEAVAKLAATLRESVQLHLVSDRPLGVFLSAGVDSSSIATLATEVGGKQLTTVSIGFDQPEFDESDRAAEIARDLGTDHRTLRVSGVDLSADLGRMLAVIDQPTVDGFNTYCASKMARQAGLTVALSGLGGDELFGGYASFRDLPRARRLTRVLQWTPFARPVLAGALRGVQRRSARKLRELLGRPSDSAQHYLLRRELFLPGRRRELGPLPEGSDRWAGVGSSVLERLQRQCAGLDRWNQVSALELTGYMREMLLRDSDVFSMVHGLELRVPLVDHVLVQEVARLPGSWKRPGPVPKPLLCDAVGPRLSQIPKMMPKRGFTFPWTAWLTGPLATHASEVLHDARVWKSLGLSPAAVAHTWDDFAAGYGDVSGLQILALVVLGDYVGRHGLERT